VKQFKPNLSPLSIQILQAMGMLNFAEFEVSQYPNLYNEEANHAIIM